MSLKIISTWRNEIHKHKSLHWKNLGRGDPATLPSDQKYIFTSFYSAEECRPKEFKIMTTLGKSTCILKSLKKSWEEITGIHRLPTFDNLQENLPISFSIHFLQMNRETSEMAGCLGNAPASECFTGIILYYCVSADTSFFKSKEREAGSSFLQKTNKNGQCFYDKCQDFLPVLEKAGLELTGTLWEACKMCMSGEHIFTQPTCFRGVQRACTLSWRD